MILNALGQRLRLCSKSQRLHFQGGASEGPAGSSCGSQGMLSVLCSHYCWKKRTVMSKQQPAPILCSSNMEIPVSAAFPPSLAVFYPTLPLLTIFTAGDLCSQPSPPRTTKFCWFCWKALQLKSHQPKTNQLWKEQHLLTRQFFPKNILASGLRIKLANKTQECFKPFVTGKSIPTQYIFQMFFIILPRYTPRNLPLHPSSHLLHRESRLSLRTHIFS